MNAVWVDVTMCVTELQANISALFPPLDDKGWQMLRRSCAQKCFVSVWKCPRCSAARIQGLGMRKNAFLEGKKHLWLWRAIQEMPAVLRGSALASSKGEPLNQHRFDWKHKQNQLTKIALSTAHKRDKNTFKSAWKVNEWACLLLTKIDDCTLKLGKL